MAQASYKQAVECYAKGDTEKAMAILQSYLNQSPQDAQAQILAGIILQNQGRLQEAVTYFKKGVELNPDPQWHVTLGGVYARLRSQPESIQEEIGQYTKAISLNPRFAGAWYALSGAYLFLGDYDQAEQAASKAVVLEPEDARYYHQLGLTFFFRGQNHRALVQFDRSNDYAVKHLSHLLNENKETPLRTWFERPGQFTLLEHLRDNRTYGFDQPHRVTPAPGVSGTYHYIDPGVYRISLTNVFIEGLFGIVYDDRHVYANHYTRFRGIWRFFHQACPMHPRETISLDRVVALQPPDLPNYYHWVAECLPQLLLIKDMMDKDPGLVFLAPNRNWPPYMAQSLDLLGIDPARRVYNTAGPKRRYFARELIQFDWQWPVSSASPIRQSAAPWYPPRSLLLKLRQILAEPFPQPGQRNSIVYVSRQPGMQRGVQNEDLLIESLRSRYQDKLVVFTGTNLSVKQQIDIFRHARLVMGPHGAGLTNILFCAPGTKIVEFPVIPAVLNFFAHLSAACGLEYWWVPEVQARFESSYVMDPNAISAIAKTLEACEA